MRFFVIEFHYLVENYQNCGMHKYRFFFLTFSFFSWPYFLRICMVCAAKATNECITVQISFILVIYFLQNLTEECLSCINCITGFMKMRVVGEKLVACASPLGGLLHKEKDDDWEQSLWIYQE